ncbi:MAG: hypothetical protein JWM05_3576, partial [Acidimicrobiales bacterium]|nr:hypothetical protein [Acidimicrobiales bacterium]
MTGPLTTAPGGAQPDEPTGQSGAAAISGEVTAVAAQAPAAGRLARLRPQRAVSHRHLLTGSGVLVIGAGVQAIGGMVFSLLVAKSKTDFGIASALFTSVLFVTYLAGLGLPVSLARYSADQSDESHVLFAWGVVASAVASIAASALYLAVVHPKAAQALWEWNGGLGFALFALVVMGSAFSLIVDVRWMTMRRWNLVLLRIVIVGVAKIALLPLGRGSGH